MGYNFKVNNQSEFEYGFWGEQKKKKNQALKIIFCRYRKSWKLHKILMGQEYFRQCIPTINLKKSAKLQNARFTTIQIFLPYNFNFITYASKETITGISPGNLSFLFSSTCPTCNQSSEDQTHS